MDRNNTRAPQSSFTLRGGEQCAAARYSLCSVLLSSRLYCRPRNLTGSAEPRLSSRALPPVGNFTHPRRSFKRYARYGHIIGSFLRCVKEVTGRIPAGRCRYTSGYPDSRGRRLPGHCNACSFRNGRRASILSSPASADPGWGRRCHSNRSAREGRIPGPKRCGRSARRFAAGAFRRRAPRRSSSHRSRA